MTDGATRSCLAYAWLDLHRCGISTVDCLGRSSLAVVGVLGVLVGEAARHDAGVYEATNGAARFCLAHAWLDLHRCNIRKQQDSGMHLSIWSHLIWGGVVVVDSFKPGGNPHCAELSVVRGFFLHSIIKSKR